MVKYKSFHTNKNKNLSPTEPYSKHTKIIYADKRNMVPDGNSISGEIKNIEKGIYVLNLN